jgi:hypothetical protein
MANLRSAVLATAMISTGLLSGSGMALAGGGDGGSHDQGKGHSHGHGKGRSHDTAGAQSDDNGDTDQHGVINSGKISPNVNPDVCGNDTPVNVLGVQVPFQDIAGSLGILTKADEGLNPGNSKSCTNPSAS